MLVVLVDKNGLSPCCGAGVMKGSWRRRAFRSAQSIKESPLFREVIDPETPAQSTVSNRDQQQSLSLYNLTSCSLHG